jgi:integrase
MLQGFFVVPTGFMELVAVQARRLPPTVERRGQPVPAALRGRRGPRLALRLPVPRQAQHAVAGHVSGHVAGPGAAQGRRGEGAAEGKNPSDLRKAEKASWAQAEIVEERKAKGLPPLDSFEAVAREWFDIKKSGWAPLYAEKIIGRLVADVFPYVGHEPVAEITPVRLLEVLRRIEKRGVIETAHRALENCSQVFRYAVATGRMTANPARDLKDALRRPEPKHMPAITDPKRFGELLRACDAYAATTVVRAAFKVAPMLLLRPGELRFAEWAEIGLDEALWTVPSARMKREVQQKLHGAPHLVPLPTQAVEVFRELRELTGRGKLVFRGERHHDRPMSNNTISARDNLGRAYNRTEFIEQRRAMLQRWADYLDELRQGPAPVNPGRIQPVAQNV